MKIEFSKHAILKFQERQIDEGDVKAVIENPDFIEEDKYDANLRHLIREIRGKFLRVVIKFENDQIKVITAYYDRGIRKVKKGEGA